MKSKSNDSQLLAEAYEDLFKKRLIIEEDEGEDKKEEKDEPKEDKEEKDESSEEKSEGSDDKEEKDEGGEEKSSNPFAPNKSEDKDEGGEESEEGEKSEEGEEGNEGGFGDGEGSEIKNKVEKLQKQYNDILIDAFDKYASECIESALSSVKSSFGENIEGILDDALKQLKDKIMGDLGVEGAMDAMGQLGGMDVDMGDDHGVEFGSNVGGVPTISVTGDQSEVEDNENPAHEAEESPEKEAEEQESGKEDEVEESNKAAFMKMIEAKKKGKGKDKKNKKENKEESLSESVANFYGFSS